MRKAIRPAANNMAPRRCYDFTAAVMVPAGLHKASVGNPPAQLTQYVIREADLLPSRLCSAMRG